MSFIVIMSDFEGHRRMKDNEIRVIPPGSNFSVSLKNPPSCLFTPLVGVAFSLPVVHHSSTITDMPLEVEQIAVLMGLFSKRCAERSVFSVAFFSSPRYVIGLSFEFIQATNFIPPCLFVIFANRL